MQTRFCTTRSESDSRPAENIKRSKISVATDACYDADDDDGDDDEDLRTETRLLLFLLCGYVVAERRDEKKRR